MKAFWRTYSHPLFGDLKVGRMGENVYVHAVDCAHKLHIIRVKKALLESKTVKNYSLVNGKLDPTVLIDIRDVANLVFYCRDVLHKTKRAEMLYDWLYDVIYPTMMEV